jgi:hypothetical protein
LIQHHEPGAPLRVAEEPDGCLESLVSLRQGAYLGVAVGQLLPKRSSRGQDHLVGQVDASGARGDEEQCPEEPRTGSAHGGGAFVDVAAAAPEMGPVRLVMTMKWYSRPE